jgi:hypothetical protein
MEEKYPIKIEKTNDNTNDKELTKYVWAFTLGDGCLLFGKDKNRPNKDINANFECGQTYEHEDYILWRANILSNITSIYLQLKEKIPYKAQIVSKSGRHPFFTTIRSRMYLNGHKVIDPHYLKLLDWETLAILYQDDGSLSKKPKGINCYTLEIATNCFSYGEQVLLQRAIKEKTDILFHIVPCRNKKNVLQYKLTIAKHDTIVTFLNGVKPFIKPSFGYKLLPNVQYPLYSRIKMDSDIV